MRAVWALPKIKCDLPKHLGKNAHLTRCPMAWNTPDSTE